MSGTGYQSLEFTEDFLDSYTSRDFSPTDRRTIKRALRLLDENERHPSLRVHELHGPLTGVWSASASDAIRLTFERVPGGRKRLLTCSRHYDR
jgi:mRNA-degrading endonuclease YafQ of YafQ-DinJ toxin-antitoxin module